MFCKAQSMNATDESSVPRIQSITLSFTLRIQEVAVAYLNPHLAFTQDASSIPITSILSKMVQLNETREKVFVSSDTTETLERKREKVDVSTECLNDNKSEQTKKTKRRFTVLRFQTEALQRLY